MLDTPNVQPDTEIVPEPAIVTPEPAPAAPAVDYEKKFAASTTENQILTARIVELEKAGKVLTTEPTDSELRAAYPEWDQLSDFEKRTARTSFNAERIAARADQTVKQLQDERSWSTSIELAVSSDPALQGKEQEFRQFASKPQYRNVPMEVLVSAFLQKSGAAPQSPKPTPKPGLETGTGGPRTPDKPNLLTAEQLSALRKSDEKAYIAYIKAHPEAIELD